MARRIEADLVVKGASQVFTATGDASSPGIVDQGAVAISAGRICWVGRTDRLLDEVLIAEGACEIDALGGVITPGFVDPHTHVVFSGSRPLEFEWRLAGKPYLEILAAGGGILSTVREVRAASEELLVSDSLARLSRMLAFGVTTCEVKSGYGLDLTTELKILRTARLLAGLQPVRIVPTFLGAHTFPPEWQEDRDAYVSHIVKEMIPAVAAEHLAEACDVFLDRGVFTSRQAERILRAALDAGLKLHIHAGQFEDLGGPQLAASLGALSVDHLDVISDEGLHAMARAGIVAVLLPGAAISLGHSPPAASRFLEAGVDVALATDCNPGTSYTENLPLMAFIGATLMGLGCAGALLAITSLAARALGKPSPEGTLGIGATADLVVHDVRDWREILYHFGMSHARHVVIGGKPVFGPS